ncbi:MAG: hypothetical protein Q4G59_03930 [Planctomycetia bacterium]|nr:hypothetical protein [Planctomycetia bacterium]
MSVCVPSSMTTEDLKFHFAEAKDGNQEAYQRLFDLHINQVLQERGFASEQFIYFERDDLLQELYMASWEGFGNLKHFNAFHEVAWYCCDEYVLQNASSISTLEKTRHSLCGSGT